MLTHRRLAALVFSSSSVLVGACQHPCPVDPAMCPQVTLTAATEPRTNYPALIQLKVPGSVLALTITPQSGVSIDKIGDLSASFCPNTDACTDDCQGIFKLASLPAPVVAADHSSRTYSIPATMLSGLTLGPGKVCISGAAVASSDVYTINRLIAAGDSSSNTLPAFDGINYYKPISFDLGKDDSNNWRGIILSETGAYRNVFSYKFSAGSFAGNDHPLQIAGAAQNLSLQSVSVLTDAFLMWGTMTNPPYRAFHCPLKDGPSSCSGNPTLDNWTVSASEKITTTAADTLATPKRFIVSLAAGTKSLKAYATPLPDGVLAPVWESDGPTGQVALATATLQSGRPLSDVIAVAKIPSIATDPDSRDVRVFLATAGGQLSVTPDASYSKGLRKGITAALGTTRALIALASGDLDGDGLSDIVMVADNPSQVVILFNPGGGAFRVAGADLKDPSGTKNDEATLITLTPPAGSIDVKAGNLDPTNPLAAQLVVLAPTTMPAMTVPKPAALLQVLSLK